MSDDRPGYADTPRIPGSAYRVHDSERPHPPAVDPGEPTTQSPPADATVLFDGTDLDGWTGADGAAPEWRIDEEEGYLEIEPGSGDIRTEAAFGDCQLHVEWRAPAEIEGESQGRGNSGVFLMDRYEIQVLDCHENPTYADGHAGAVYGQTPPLVNACREPGAWQSYDIAWTAPRFESGALAAPATVTVLHNGVVVQNGTELHGPTTHRDVRDYEPHPSAGPLRLQDHGDRVRFRNVWVRSLERSPDERPA